MDRYDFVELYISRLFFFVIIIMNNFIRMF